ncbi:MAG: MoxR family ATPase [Defluviitaleaceae bacterium]|nr:MoxR family ATPase [Defluviitaleaceae bacterium]
MELAKFTNYRDKILQSCGKVILGKEESILLTLICFVCSGHVLIEDIPGTGKTMLLRSFAKTIGGGFKRIQFTPDLLPSDLTGINFYNQKVSEFEFKKGPLFANIILADEINRATPRTQASLLEAMEEGQITVDGTTYMLERPFMVMATQNPLESYGTFPLPDAQIDRFFMRLSMGYMQRGQEMDVISRPSTIDIVESLSQVVTDEETEYIRQNYKLVKVSDDVKGYIMDIVEGTRTESGFISGVSTRGAIALYKAAQAKAALSGKDYVTPEDVRFVAPYVLMHRLNIGGGRGAQTSAEILESIISKVKVPIEDIS